MLLGFYICSLNREIRVRKEDNTVRKVKSCGILCFRKRPTIAFLLMRHPHRYDLPKGHIREGESERVCAIREFTEETGISEKEIKRKINQLIN